MKRSKATIQMAENEELTPKDRARLAEYLSLLYADGQGQTHAQMAREICGIDPETEPARAKRVLVARIGRARWLAAHAQRLLLEEGLPAKAGEGHRSRLR